MDHHTVAAVSITGTCLDVIGSLYRAYDLLGGRHGPLRLLTRAVTYSVVFGVGYGLGLGLFFGLAFGMGGIGSAVLGGFFSYIEPRLGADTHTKSGVLYGIVTWLVVMLVFLPAAGAGNFGFQLSVFAPLVTLALHVLYGGVLGWTYGKLAPTLNPFTKHHPA